AFPRGSAAVVRGCPARRGAGCAAGGARLSTGIPARILREQSGSIGHGDKSSGFVCATCRQGHLVLGLSCSGRESGGKKAGGNSPVRRVSRQSSPRVRAQRFRNPRGQSVEQERGGQNDGL